MLSINGSIELSMKYALDVLVMTCQRPDAHGLDPFWMLVSCVCLAMPSHLTTDHLPTTLVWLGRHFYEQNNTTNHVELGELSASFPLSLVRSVSPVSALLEARYIWFHGRRGCWTKLSMNWNHKTRTPMPFFHQKYLGFLVRGTDFLVLWCLRFHHHDQKKIRQDFPLTFVKRTAVLTRS